MLSKLAVPNSFFKIMGAQRWLKLARVISLVSSHRPAVYSEEFPGLKVLNGSLQIKKDTRSTEIFYVEAGTEYHS